MGTSLDNLKDEFRVQLPGVADAVINLELFNTIDELAREALRATPPSDVDANPSTWLSAGNYTLHYQTLLHGTLAKLYAQVAKPYMSTDLAKAHFELYREYMKLSAAEAANTDVATRPIRLISAIQVQAPGARDAAIELELFNTADELAREALRITPPVTTDPVASWLPTLPVDQWTPNYQCLFAGTLGRLLAQVDKSLASSELAKYHFDPYLRYLDHARGEGAAVAATDTIQVRL